MSRQLSDAVKAGDTEGWGPGSLEGPYQGLRSFEIRQSSPAISRVPARQSTSIRYVECADWHLIVA
jgi:hypothetical protein